MAQGVMPEPMRQHEAEPQVSDALPSASPQMLQPVAVLPAQEPAVPHQLLAPALQRSAEASAQPAFRLPRDDAGERCLLRLAPVRLSLRVGRARSPLRGDDAPPPAARQPARASHAPSERECGQPDRRSADSDGCAQERPSGEAG